MEIVVHGTLEATLVEVLLIGDAGIQLVVIRRFECHIAEVHQDDNALKHCLTVQPTGYLCF